jgi:GAF domain
MSSRYSLDRESFENFLANAHAVQESGLDPQSLSALIEIQQFIAIGDFDLEQAMQKISDHVYTLLNASGVALAVLDGNELVYRAGAGNGIKDVGRHVLAVLNVSSPQDMHREILRVEDAETDTRIQSEICRQFGAKSLLMLPICKNDELLGVLQVHFNDRHAFLDHEIRVCRLMIGALETEMLRRTQFVETHEKEPCAETTPAMPCDSTQEADPVQSKVAAATAPVCLNQNVNRERTRTHNDDRSASVVSQELQIETLTTHTTNSFWARLTSAVSSMVSRSSTATFSRAGFALTAALMITAITSLSSVHHSSTTTRSSAAATQPETPSTSPANLIPVNDEPNLWAPRDNVKQNLAFRRVTVGPNEVDYIAEDVTIRRFTIASPKPHARPSVKEVNFGDDVTVRYFTNDSATLSRPASPELRPATTTHPPSVSH